METFQVLGISAVLRRRIGIYSWHLTHPDHDFFKAKSTYWILFFLLCGLITSSAMHIIKNAATIANQLETLLPVIAGSQCAGMFLGVGCNMEKVRKLHRILQKMVDNGLYSASNFEMLF